MHSPLYEPRARALEGVRLFVTISAEVTPVAEIGELTFKPAAISLSLMDDDARLVRRELGAA